MPVIVTRTLVLHAAFVSTRTGSADAYIAVLFVGPFAAVGLFYVLMLVGWVVKSVGEGSELR